MLQKHIYVYTHTHTQNLCIWVLLSTEVLYTLCWIPSYRTDCNI
jgi:hypothetical protein